MTLFYDDCKSFPQLVQYIRARTPEEFLSQVALGYVVHTSPIVKSTLPLAKKYDAKPEEVDRLNEWSCYARESQEQEPQSVYDFTLHLMEHLDSYEKAFALFEDDWSQLTFFQMILFRLLPYTGTHLDQMRSDSFSYFRKELLEEAEQGVLVDVGAYLGQSPMHYIQSYGDQYKKIYVFEPNPVSMERCKERMGPLSHVVYSDTALAQRTGKGYFTFDDSFSHLHPSQGEEVLVDTLDHAVTEPISFLKINVSGGELEVLQGATEHLRQDKPKVALSIARVTSHLFQIPLFLKELNPDQSFYLRYHGVKDSTIGFVLYAKPSVNATPVTAAPTASVAPVTDLDAQLKAAMTSLSSPTTETVTAPPTAPATGLDAKLKAAIASFASPTPVTPAPATDLDAQLKVAMASLTSPTSAPVTSAPVAPATDLDAQLKAAMASLTSPTSAPVAPATDLDVQLKAAMASLTSPTTVTPPVTAAPVAPATDLDAQLKAAMASLTSPAPTTPEAPVSEKDALDDLDAQLKVAMASLSSSASVTTTPAPPVSALDAQLQAMKNKLTAMSSGLEHVKAQDNVQNQMIEGLTFSVVEGETPLTDAMAMLQNIPSAVPAVPVTVPGKSTQNALDLIETMTEGVQYLRSTCESDSIEFHSIMESLELSLGALSRSLKE